MVVTFRYELEIDFFKLGRKKSASILPCQRRGSEILDCLNSASESLYSNLSCFKIRAKTLRISLGHTFHPIEVKLGVLPILVILNQR
jgi:hypothetical protein